MGILILFFLAVGAGTILYYLGKGVAMLYRKYHPAPEVTELQTLINSAMKKPLPNNRPRNPPYSGCKFESLEVKAIIVKRIEEIEKMSAWDRYVMDFKDGCLDVREAMAEEMAKSVFTRISAYVMTPIFAMMLVAKPGFLLLVVPLVLYLMFKMLPSAEAAGRRAFKNYFSILSPDAMHKVYMDVADSNARVEEMRTAFQSSGCIHRIGRW